MTFIQIVSFRCTDLPALRDIEEEWLAATEARRTLLRETVLVDRNDPTHIMAINEFESYETAMRNSSASRDGRDGPEGIRVADRRADVPRPRHRAGHRFRLVTAVGGLRAGKLVGDPKSGGDQQVA